MKKYLVAILCGLIFTVGIGWAAETLDRYKDQLSQSRKIQSLESKVADLEDRVQGLEDELKTLQLRVEEIATK
jgi:prefoldin subunit 5